MYEEEISPEAKARHELAEMRNEVEALVTQLIDQRQSWEPTWIDIGEQIAPYHHELDKYGASGQNRANGTSANDGDQRDQQIINETPSQALAVAVSGTLNAVSDPTEEIFGLQTADPELSGDHEVEEWLEETAKIVRSELNKSNFFTVAPEFYANILAFGTAAQICLEDFGKDTVLWFANIPTGSFYLGNDARNKPSIFARKMAMTAHQMKQEFGLANCSTRVKDACKDKRSQDKFNITHVIKPNPKYVEGMEDGGKPFIDCYYEDGEKTIPFLRVSGFDSNPIQAARWMTRGNIPYGFGPGHYAVRSCKALQAYEYDLALAREKEINPPMIAPPGVGSAQYSLLPGFINTVSDPAGAQGLRPAYQISFNTQHAKEGIQELERRIREAFYNNIFLMIANDTGGKMTAREVVERAHEKRLALTPILRLTNEYLTPTISRALDILGKRGKLPPYPESLRGQQLVVQYKSVLAAAASLEKANAVTSHMLGFMAPLVELFPEIRDNYDIDEMMRDHFTNSGGGVKNLRSEQERDEIRGERAAQQEAAQKQQEAMQMAETAKTLAGADMSGKNALTELAGQQ